MATKTNLAGKKIDKDDLIFEVLGSLDKVSAAIGLAKVKANIKEQELLSKVQKDLSFFSSVIAECGNDEVDQRLDWLEKEIEDKESEMEISKEFVLPGKNEIEARLNFARVVVRQAERKAVKLNKQTTLDQCLLDYLNRLSWFLFLLGLESRE